MGLIYLAALIIALGALLAPMFLGGHGADADAGDVGDAGDAGHDPGVPHAGVGLGHGDPLVTLFLSLRFWAFAALGFGLSGSLLHLFALAGPLVIFGLALGTGLSSGLFAALAYRALRQSTTGTSAASSDAVGRVGRVIVACARGKTGQVRLQLAGQSVDLAATTDEDAIARGEPVLVAEVHDGTAHVMRPPPEVAP